MKIALVLTIFIATVIKPSDSSIGLVQATNYMEVSSKKVEFPLTILMTVFNDLGYQKTLLTELKAKFEGFKTMNGIKDMPDETKAGLILKVTAINELLSDTEKYATTVYGYKNTDIEAITSTSCAVQIKNNVDTDIFAAANFLTASIDVLGNAFTAEQLVNGSEQLSRVLNVLQDSYHHITTLNEKIIRYINDLESLTSGHMSPSVSAYVQQSRCVAESEMDHIKVLSCRKNIKGLVCDLEVEIYESSQKYLLYRAVNYDGVEITIPDEHILVKSPNNKYGLLMCRDEPVETVNDCIFTPWSHTSVLFSDDPVNALLLSNFSLSPPPLPVQTYDTGVLIMNSDVFIKSKTGTSTKDVENKSPMKIRFDQSTSIVTEIEQTVLEFKGGNSATNLEIELTVYNSTSIDLMHEKALKDALDNFDWVNIMKYFGLVVQVAVLPVAFTSCSLSVFALIKSILSYRKKQRKEKLENRYNLRRNYELNKRVAKKVRK